MARTGSAFVIGLCALLALPAFAGGAEPELYGAGIVSGSVASDAVLWSTGVTRAVMLLGLAAAVTWAITRV